MSYLFHVFLNFLAVTAFLMFFCVGLELQLQFFRGRNCDEASSWCLFVPDQGPLSVAERGASGTSSCLLKLSIARCHQDSSSCRRNCPVPISGHFWCPLMFPVPLFFLSEAKSLSCSPPSCFSSIFNYTTLFSPLPVCIYPLRAYTFMKSKASLLLPAAVLTDLPPSIFFCAPIFHTVF